MRTSKGVGGLLGLGVLCTSFAVAWSGVDPGSETSRIALSDSDTAIVRTDAASTQAGATGMHGSAFRLAQAGGQTQPSSSALGSYLGLVDLKISTNWMPIASKEAKEAKAVVRFRVMRDGQVREITLETSSGDPILDEAAMTAIRASAPFPAFPPLLLDPHLDLRYQFFVEEL